MKGNGKAGTRRLIDANAVLQRYGERIARMYRAPTVRTADMLARGMVDAGLLPRAKGTGAVEVQYAGTVDALEVTITCHVRIAVPAEE